MRPCLSRHYGLPSQLSPASSSSHIVCVSRGYLSPLSFMDLHGEHGEQMAALRRETEQV